MAAVKHLSGIDLAQTELQNAVIQNLASAPSSPKPGQLYWSTAGSVLYVYTGVTNGWRPTDASKLTDGSIPNSALATNPLSRANHTGTQSASTISDLATTVKNYTHSDFQPPTLPVSWGGQRLTSLAAGVSGTDGVNLDQLNAAIQSAAAGIDSKASVRVIATANVSSLSGLQTIDGVSLAAGDRVLLAGQTTASANGVYVAASGAWTRATDADTTGEITPGAFWFVEEGTTNGRTQWRVNNTGTITVGTTAITIVQFGAANNYSAAASGGLQLIGSEFSVKLRSGSGLVVDSTGLGIDVTQVLRKKTGTITHDGTTTTFRVSHGLNTLDIMEPTFRDSSGTGVKVDWKVFDTDKVDIIFGAALANGTAINWVIAG